MRPLARLEYEASRRCAVPASLGRRRNPCILIFSRCLTDFKAGIGMVIVLDQAPKLLGIHFDKSGFLENLLALVGHLPVTSLPTLLVGGSMLVI